MNENKAAKRKKLVKNIAMNKDFARLESSVYNLGTMLQTYSDDLIAAGKYDALDKLIKNLIVTTGNVEDVMFNGLPHGFDSKTGYAEVVIE
jgi:hypothetical protein